MLDQPENRAKVRAIIDEIERAYAGFSALRDDLARVEEHRDTLLKAAGAAEREAEDAREELRALARATLGKPDKALSDQQRKHRAALETAEDYRALAREADEEATALRVEMSPFARTLKTRQQDLYKTFSRLVLAEAVDEIAPRLKIVRDALRAEYERPEFIPAARHVFASHEEILRDLLGAAIDQAFRPERVSAELPDYIRAALRKNTGDFQPFSMIQMVRLRKGLPPSMPNSLPPHERKAVPL